MTDATLVVDEGTIFEKQTQHVSICAKSFVGCEAVPVIIPQKVTSVKRPTKYTPFRQKRPRKRPLSPSTHNWHNIHCCVLKLGVRSYYLDPCSVLEIEVELVDVDNGIANSNDDGNTVNSFSTSISGGISLWILSSAGRQRVAGTDVCYQQRNNYFESEPVRVRTYQRGKLAVQEIIMLLWMLTLVRSILAVLSKKNHLRSELCVLHYFYKSRQQKALL